MQEASYGTLFGGVARGQLQVPLDQALPLAQAAEAPRRPDSCQSPGNRVLLPYSTSNHPTSTLFS
ncbi:hypothetical protein [Hymenobacter terricola]|uniref:hypothetical protein n=1 Tax=Hymenobacter terricola TaxID=2819236 RepID=UPI001B305DF1|nr:hypothetical protein [Hymenobacter terricola]